jgi:hypothetical protein
MVSWVLALALGALGAGLGAWAASGAGVTSAQPLWALSGGAWFAILGAVLGGVIDVVQAIKASAKK